MVINRNFTRSYFCINGNWDTKIMKLTSVLTVVIFITSAKAIQNSSSLRKLKRNCLAAHVLMRYFLRLPRFEFFYSARAVHVR